MSGTNVVSSREIDARHHAVAGYMNWVQEVQILSSFLKDGWLRPGDFGDAGAGENLHARI
jgi:hypothetical protein